MTIQKIIQEAINKSPRDLKEALEEELRSRISESIAEKMEEVELGEAVGQNAASEKLMYGNGARNHNGHEGAREFHLNAADAHREEGNIKAASHHTAAATAHQKALNALKKSDYKAARSHAETAADHAERAVKHGGDDSDSYDIVQDHRKMKINESLELDEAIKPGDRVKIHKPGKDYHGHIGTVGEVRKRTYGTGAPSYTIDYYKPGSDHRHSVTLNRDEFKKHKEQRGLLDAKESFDLSDYSIEELEDFMESADFIELIELSPKTLQSYREKANKHIDKLQKIVDRSDKIIDKHNLARARSRGADRIASNARSDAELRRAETQAGRAARTAATTGKKAADAEKIKDAANNKIDKRELGIDRAYDRLHKESVEQIDEISGKTLGSYIQKARAQDSARISNNKALDAHPKVKALRDKMNDLYNRREYTKTGASKHQKTINKLRSDIEAQKKKLDPNYPDSAYPKRHKGIEKAVKKLTYGKMTDSYNLSDLTLEELEGFMESAEFDQLDEISKKTLASYVDKASDNAALHGIGYGEKKAQSDEMDRMMNRHMSYSDKDKVRDIMKTSRKDVEEPREKMVKRLRGISTAAKKLSGGAKVPAGDK